MYSPTWFRYTTSCFIWVYKGIYYILSSKYRITVCVILSLSTVLYQPPVMISISARLQKLCHTFNLYDVTSSIALCKGFIKTLICMTSCQTYNLYDVNSNLLICMTSCHIKNIYLRYMYIIKCIWYGFFNITHRINPQSI